MTISNHSSPYGGEVGRGAVVPALILLLAGLVMAFIALFLPPPGEIHESVLYIFAQILIYAGSVFGIDAYIKKIVHDNHDSSGSSPSEKRG